MIVLRKNDIPSVVGDNSGRDKAEREDMDAKRRKKKKKQKRMAKRGRGRDRLEAELELPLWNLALYRVFTAEYVLSLRKPCILHMYYQQNKHYKHTCSGLERRRR